MPQSVQAKVAGTAGILAVLVPAAILFAFGLWLEHGPGTYGYIAVTIFTVFAGPMIGMAAGLYWRSQA